MAATSSGTAVVTLPAANQILITREFAAPQHLVYRAWTTPELIKRWWSANRGTVTVIEVDLRVLRAVGLVDVRENGRQRIYRLDARPLKPIHDWVKTYERQWEERFQQLDAVLEELKRMEDGDGGDE